MECEVSRKMHKEGTKKHRDSTLISDHRGELHWHNEQEDSRRHILKGDQAIRATEIEGQANV